MAARPRTFRVTVPDVINSITIPDLGNPLALKYVSVRNVSTGLLPNAFRFNFEGDGASNYIELQPSTTNDPYVFGGIRGGEIVYIDGVGGSATMDVTVWEV